MFKDQAKKIFAVIYPNRHLTEFNASNGWLDNFKQRYGIRLLRITGEKLSCDVSQIGPFFEKFYAKVREMELTPEQIYNADESALFYRILPTKTFVAATEKSAPGTKSSKERFTFMLCSNSTGTHEVTQLVIGKSKNPRCFAGFKNPLDYNSSKNAWMTNAIFEDWFHNHFCKQVNKTFCEVFSSQIAFNNSFVH